MATSREKLQKFLDQVGVSTLWARILQELDTKTSKEEFAQLKSRTDVIEFEPITLYGGSASDVIEEELHNE